MRPNPVPVFRDVVLVGGGHTHALLIRKWGTQPLPGVRITLVSPDPLTPYSGMLPGMIAGHYSFGETHIDLSRLCHWAGVRFIQDTAAGLDTGNKRVLLKSRPELEYDVLSLDTGSTPADSVPGIAEFAVPVKPIAGFWPRWQSLLEKMLVEEKRQTIAVVGGGAGSVEIVLAMAHACRHIPALKHNPEFHLLTRADKLLPGYPGKVRRAAMRACANASVQVHANWDVAAITANGLQGALGTTLVSDHVFWCGQACAPGWPQQAGLTCDSEGFVTVNAFLQSVSHPDIFVAGDLADMQNSPRAKAGVYAVRQAPALFRNIQHFLLGEAMKPYKPQDNFLSLLALGDKYAAGNRGGLSIAGRWAWHWKDRIDRTFMQQFVDLPGMTYQFGLQDLPASFIASEEPQETLDSNLRCAGCGGKVGPVVLEKVLSVAGQQWHPEDAASVSWPGKELVQSVDQISAPFDDPWLFGRISVLHALNDLIARNAKPHSIQVMVTLPFAGRKCQERELHLVLDGIHDACREENVRLLGGHTGEGPRLTVGVTANGLPEERSLAKQGAEPGDVLMLNKPLGTGIVLAGHMLNVTPGRVLQSALDVMAISNSQVRSFLSSTAVHACTDVSGFGLLGHLSEMVKGTALKPEIEPDALPLLSGVNDLVNTGIRASLLPQNASHVAGYPWAARFRGHAMWPVMLDPQTSGGLLVSVEEGFSAQLEAVGFYRFSYVT